VLEPQAGGAPPASPCCGVCRLDEAGFCLGCRRSLTEIARWREMSAAEQRAVLALLSGRGEPET